MNKTALSMALMLALPAFAIAGPRSLAEMKSAARQAIPAAQTGARSVAGGDLKVLKQGSQYTVIGYANGGFAVIANDDRFAPVLGYSDGKVGDDAPLALQWWMDAVDESLERQLAEGTNTRAEVDRPTTYSNSVAPLLTTTWGQETPYNNLTPVYTTAEGEAHYMTGCVSTAMSQIMNYHEWPVTGTGSSSYQFTPVGGQAQTLSANYGETTYDWANMLDSYAGTYNDAQATAVATLLYHCGVSTEMQYNQTGSGTPSVNACRALKTYFGYDSDIDIYNREAWPLQEWMNVVWRELNDHCPILFSGVRADGLAHAFVIDGYDENGLMHVNWGWEGVADGYFDITLLNGFSLSQEMVVVRRPDDNRFTYTAQPHWGLNGDLNMEVSGYYLLISQRGGNGLFNASSNLFSGVVAVVAENMEDGTITQLSSPDIDEIMPISNANYGAGISLTGNLRASFANLLEGEYRVYFAVKATGDDTWYPVLSNEKNNNNFILNVGRWETTVTEGDPQWCVGIEGVTVGNPSDGIVNVYTVDGVKVYSAPAAGFSIDDVPATGLLIVKNGAETTKVMKK